MKTLNTTITILSFILLLISLFVLSNKHSIDSYWYMVLGLSAIISAGLLSAPKYTQTNTDEKHIRLKILHLLSTDETINFQDFSSKYKRLHKYCDQNVVPVVLYDMIQEKDLVIENNLIKIKTNI